MTDTDYMKLALDLADKGAGLANPNPLVGAVIVKQGRIIGRGWHQAYGQPHAERNALADCLENPRGADLYVTLEPCCHYGKTPPCTEAIINAGISRVIIGSSDPNPLVAGKGKEILENHGISVTQGVLKQECDALNQIFFHYIQTGTPYVIMKYAMTMDGKIAAYTGKSQWISGAPARQHVQETRRRLMGIMTGVGTIITDNPRLTCRIEGARSPVRIICDTHLNTPLSSYVVQTAKTYPTILATCCKDENKQSAFLNAGCQILITPAKDGHVDLKDLMLKLGKQGIDSILLEGGAALNWSALNSGIVKKVQTYLAPKLLGGSGAKSPVGGIGAKDPDHGFFLSLPAITVIGTDLLLESEVYPCLQES